MRELVTDEAPEKGSCCDDEFIICHLGSWIWGFTDVVRMIVGDGDDVALVGENPSSSISVGDSRMRLDSSALNLGTVCSRDRARVAMVILPLFIWLFGTGSLRWLYGRASSNVALIGERSIAGEVLDLAKDGPFFGGGRGASRGGDAALGGAGNMLKVGEAIS